MNVAMPGAQETVHAAATFRLPPTGFVQGFRLLEDFQIAHDPPPADSILPARARRGLERRTCTGRPEGRPLHREEESKSLTPKNPAFGIPVFFLFPLCVQPSPP